MVRRVHIRVSGRVQGVSYRASAQEKAVSLDLVGWVRNTSDGAVQIVAQGDSGNITSFIDWCRRGPRWARVERLEMSEEHPAQNLISFTIRQDG